MKAIDPITAFAIAGALLIGVPGIIGAVGALCILIWEYRR